MEENPEKEEKSVERNDTTEYHDYLSVFQKKESGGCHCGSRGDMALS